MNGIILEIYEVVVITLKYYIFQDREFVEVDLPFNGALKKVGPAASSAPSPTPSDSANQSLFNNCCGKSNCCRKVSDDLWCLTCIIFFSIFV